VNKVGRVSFLLSSCPIISPKSLAAVGIMKGRLMGFNGARMSQLVGALLFAGSATRIATNIVDPSRFEHSLSGWHTKCRPGVVHCQSNCDSKITSGTAQPLSVSSDPASDSIMKRMKSTFPNCSSSEIHRFLVARNWDLEKASAMLQSNIEWKSRNLPLDAVTARPVLDQQCFIVHGEDREGDPIIFFRWGLYDSSKAGSKAYVLTICHLMNYVFESRPSCSLNVFVDLSIVAGGMNGYADIEFIRSAIKVFTSAQIP
jgi:hypothetical protein